jgi:hypothetical protein
MNQSGIHLDLEMPVAMAYLDVDCSTATGFSYQHRIMLHAILLTIGPCKQPNVWRSKTAADITFIMTCPLMVNFRRFLAFESPINRCRLAICHDPNNVAPCLTQAPDEH